MRNLIFIILSCLSMSISASESLNTALELFKTKAYRKSEVNWNKVEQEARKILKVENENKAIAYLVDSLGDNHTSYWPKNSSGAQQTPVLKSKAIAETSPPISNIPVLKVNAWMGQDQNKAAQKVREELLKAKSVNSCGIILDFSSNSGGNMWPMVVGLSPLLADGRLGAFINPENKRTVIKKDKGIIYVDSAPYFLNYKMPSNDSMAFKAIAIIVGHQTASSGEITPLMFLGQENVQLFGKKTAGMTSANQVFYLPNGGRLFLTTALTEDRNGKIHSNGILPALESDMPYEEAASWIQKICKDKNV